MTFRLTCSAVLIAALCLVPSVARAEGDGGTSSHEERAERDPQMIAAVDEGHDEDASTPANGDDSVSSQRSPHGSLPDALHAELLEALTLDAVRFEHSSTRSENRGDLLGVPGERTTQRVRVDQPSSTGARTVAQLLARMTEYRSAEGDGTAPTIEGLSGAYTHVLVDGLPAATTIQTRQGPTVDLASIPVTPDEIERIDVYQGIGPSGSGTASGVVLDIITRRDLPPGMSLSTGLTAGESGLYGWDAAARGSIRPTDDVTIRLGATANTMLRNDLTGDGLDNAPLDRTLGFSGSFMWSPDDERRVAFATDFSQHSTDRSAIGLHNITTLRTLTARLRADLPLTDNWDVSLLGHMSQSSNAFIKSPSVGADYTVSSVQLSEGSATSVFSTALGDVDLAIEVCGQGHAVAQVDRSGAREDVSEGEACLSLSAMWWASDVFELSVRALGGYHSAFGARAVAGSSATWRPSANWSVGLSADINQRTPTTDERFQLFDHASVGYVIEGNPDLGIEQTVSLRSTVGASAVNGSVAGQLAAFVHFQRDRIQPELIETAATSGYDAALYTYSNIGAARTAGVRAELRTSSANERFGATVRYTWMPHFQNLADDERIELQSEHQLRAMINGSLVDERLQLWASAGVHSPLSWNSGDAGAPPDTVQISWDAGVVGRVHERLALEVTASNITNQTDSAWGPFYGWNLRFGLRFDINFNDEESE